MKKKILVFKVFNSSKAYIDFPYVIFINQNEHNSWKKTKFVDFFNIWLNTCINYIGPVKVL